MSSRWTALLGLVGRSHCSVKAKQAGGYRKLRGKVSTVTGFESVVQDLGEIFVEEVMNTLKK